MNKLYLLGLGLFTCLYTSAQSEVFFDDFEDNNLEGYTLYNLDGLTPDDPDLSNMADSAWTIRFISSQGWEYGNSAFSVSWYQGDEGPSDDWLITPGIEIGTNSMLTWDAMAITSSGEFRDRYQVFIGPSNDLADFEALAPVFDTGDIGEIDAPTAHSIDLQALGFENETIFIAFRNNTQPYDPDGPSGPGNGGNELAIDNISVSSILSATNPDFFKELTLMPNPSHGDSKLIFSIDESAQTFMEIADITGKIVSSENFGNLANGNHMIDVNRGDIQPGVYLIRLRTDKGSTTIRAIFN